MKFKSRLKGIALLLGTASVAGNLYAQQKVQSFDAEITDNWAYVNTPDAYNDGGFDVWDATTSLAEITPIDGTQLWGMRDLDNPNGGGAFDHTIDFETVDISSYLVNILSFKYYSVGFEDSDVLGYILETDNGSEWNTDNVVELERNTNAWTTVTVTIPEGSQYVRLRLFGNQNGGSDYAAFDEVSLFGSNDDIFSPSIITANYSTANTITISLTEEISEVTLNTLSNYAGIDGLTSVTQEEVDGTYRLTLTYSNDFVNGQANSLVVSGLEDLAGNALEEPFTYDFIYNNSTPDVMVSEIMYNNPGDDVYEFIELYNNSDEAIALGGLRLAGAITHTFAEQDLAAGATFLLAADADACEVEFGGDFTSWTSGGLSNGGNTIEILNTNDEQVDIVEYDDAAPWPTSPDGNGPSLELLSYQLDNSLATSWKACEDAVAGTVHFANPGIVNNDVTPILSFSEGSTSTNEADETLSISVDIANPADVAVSVDVVVASASTAVANEDYTYTTTTLTFPANSATSQNITIDLIDDVEADNSRYLILEFDNFNGSEAGTTDKHYILINDDDAAVPTPMESSVVSMRHLGSFNFPEGASAEIVSHDAASQRLYVVNSEQNFLEVIDFSNPLNVSITNSISLEPYGAGINSVAVKDGIVVVAVEAAEVADAGQLVFFDADGNYLNAVTAGVLPDMVCFTHDGTKVLSANEAEPSDDYLTDPEGSVTIVDISGGIASLSETNVTQVTFTAYNDQEAALQAAGIRVFGQGATVAQDLEPEYIAISEDSQFAYVSMQENNAYAVIDLSTNTIDGLYSFGVKDFSELGNAYDGSDKSDGIFMNRWNVKGFYQPDAIAAFGHEGANFIVTANEGDARDYDGYSEETRLGSGDYILDETAFPNAEYLENNALLGRLKVTKANGDIDNDGDYDEIYAYGGRSFSIHNASTNELIYDSKDEFARIIANHPEYQNWFNDSGSPDGYKSRSDDKGTEPEAVVVGEINGERYAFIGLERIGGVMMYLISDPSAPQYVQYINTRVEGGDVGPEGMIFVPAEESPNGRNMLVVASEVSGTVSMFQLDVNLLNTEDYTLDHAQPETMDEIGTYNGLTIHEGGISGLHAINGEEGYYYMITDRGPNAIATNHPDNIDGDNIKLFPFPTYAPKIMKVHVEGDNIVVDEMGTIKRPGGADASGLPLPDGLGATGELAWDGNNMIVAPDNWGLDSEGIVESNDGYLWVCEEYGSSIWKLNKETFEVEDRYTPFVINEDYDNELPTEVGLRRPNRGFEGIAYTPNGMIYSMLQAPVYNPDATVGKASRLHRLIQLNPETGETQTYVYEHDAERGEIRSQDWKIGDIVAINNNEFLVIEHAQRNGWNYKNIYKIDITDATPLTTEDFGGQTLEALMDAETAAGFGINVVAKTLFVDLLDLGWDLSHDKPEGISIIDANTIAIVNDNDYGVDAPEGDGVIVTTGKTTQLYEYNLPEALTLDYVNPFCSTSLGEDIVICEGESTMLDAGAGASFVWSNGLETQSIEVTEAGTYGVTRVNEFGCDSYDELVVSVVTNTLDLEDTMVLCVNDEIELDAGAGVSYSWSNGEETQTIDVDEAGTYSVTVTNTNGCEYTDEVVITASTLLSLDLGDSDVLCEGETMILDAGAGAASYEWSTGEETQTIEISEAGFYTVTVTGAGGCELQDVISIIIDPCVGLDEYAQQSIQIVPNPSNGAITLELKDQKGTYDLLITDITGQQVLRKQYVLNGSERVLPINLEQCTAGIYLLQWASDKAVQQQTLIIE